MLDCLGYTTALKRQVQERTGRPVLVATGQAVRALVHREEQVRQVEALGAFDAIAGDMRDPAVLARAVRGARAVYHTKPAGPSRRI